LRRKEIIMKSPLIPVILLVLALPAAAGARTWLIEDDGSGDAPTIQAGIDSAAAADTVLLADGTYTGAGNRDIDFKGKAIVVRSQSGNCNLCVIDCEASGGDQHTGFIFDSGEDTTSVLEGVTVMGGYREDGGGVACYYCSPKFNACCFTGNAATQIGGVFDMINSTAIINNCLFLSNEATAGGAIYTDHCSITLSGCTFNSNTASGNGGALYLHANTPTLVDCTISNNSGLRGGGMYLDGGCSASIAYCKFYENEAQYMGGGMRCSNASPTLENCTFACDSSAWGGAAVDLASGDEPGFTNVLIAFSRTGKAIECEGSGAGIGFACCNIYGNEGGDWVGCIAVHAGLNGNMSSDPRFCDLPSGDVHVESCSPCLAGNNTCGVDIGSGGSGCGCGEATEPTTWGGVKALYR
jgi:predicted outer membrane repeat protein/parallel beta-helix repeat protein